MNYNIFVQIMKQSHTLIGGRTGGGKSVALNGVIHAILQHSPGAVKMVLVDPKCVELRPYRRAPHCIRYADTPPEMLQVLEDVASEMDARYRRMAAREWCRETSEPHIYLIVDELADLLDTAGKPALIALKRIAQKGRAAHIHIIAATQHVNRRTLPAELQINFPAVLALPVRSGIESRQLIGQTGAELLTVGNAYFVSPDTAAPIRVNVPYIPETQLRAALDRWTAGGRIASPAPAPTPAAAHPPAERHGWLRGFVKNHFHK